MLRIPLRTALIVAVGILTLTGATAEAIAAKKKMPLAVSVGVVKVQERSLTVVLRIHTRAGAKCSPTVSARQLSFSLPQVVANKRGAATVKWRVESGAPRGQWTFRVRCSKGRASVTKVKRARISLPPGGSPSLMAPGSLDITTGAAAKSPPSQAADGKGAGGNPFPGGWCTWGAWDKAQWLGGAVTGNANQWAGQAAAAGLSVGSAPAVDAVYVNTAGYYGHVGVVTKVNSPTSFDMVDMNGGALKPSPPAEYGVTYDFGVFKNRTNRSTGGAIRFIYKPGTGPGNAGPGTGPGPEPGGQSAGITGAIALGIGVLDSVGDFHVKVGDLGAPWVREAGPSAQQIALSGNRIGVLDSAGDFYVKEGDLGAPWVREAGPGAKQIALSGNRIGVLDSAGDFHVKEGSLYAPWIREAGPGALKIALSGNRIGVLDSAGDFHVKEGDLGATWIREAGPGAKQIALSGNRIGVLDSAGDFHVKEGSLYAPWIREAGPGAQQIALPGG